MSDIDKMTIGEAKALAAMFSTSPRDDSHWQIGRVYLIRTVTHIQTGRLVAVTQAELILEEAAWIADTGRFSGALTTAEFSEVEPFPEGKVIVGRGALIDAVEIRQAPRSQK